MEARLLDWLPRRSTTLVGGVTADKTQVRTVGGFQKTILGALGATAPVNWLYGGFVEEILEAMEGRDGGFLSSGMYVFMRWTIDRQSQLDKRRKVPLDTKPPPPPSSSASKSSNQT